MRVVQLSTKIQAQVQLQVDCSQIVPLNQDNTFITQRRFQENMNMNRFK